MNAEIDIQAKYFFPIDKEFWFYNIAGWGLIFLYLITISYITNGSILKVIFSIDFLIISFGCIEGTLAGLVFRYCYFKHQWYSSNFIKILPYAFLISLLSALLFALVVALTVYFYSGIPTKFLSENGSVLLLTYLYEMMVGNGTISFMIVAIWCFLYLSIKNTQNSRELLHKTLKLENHLKEARLNVLSAQINPHFLFNAMNNIRFQIHENAERADESLISLSEILRHSLESSKKEKIQLSQEIAIVQQYLKLMKNQMEERLSYSVDVDLSVESSLIPPMIIQMLTENAIKHGIELQKNGGRIEVSCQHNLGRLLLQVSNSTEGGISRTETIIQDNSKSIGLGLKNITKRLLLLYGSEAELSILQDNNQVKVTIELPIEVSA